MNKTWTVFFHYPGDPQFVQADEVDAETFQEAAFYATQIGVRNKLHLEPVIVGLVPCRMEVQMGTMLATMITHILLP